MKANIQYKNKMETKIARLEEQMKSIKEEVAQVRGEMGKGFDRIEKKLDCYVRKNSYKKDRVLVDNRLKLLEKIIYGLIGLMLTGIVGAIMSLVLK